MLRVQQYRKWPLNVTRDDMKNIFPIFKSVAEESNLVTNEQLKIIMQVVEEKEMVSYQ